MDLIIPYMGRNNWKGKDVLLHRDLMKTNHLNRAMVCYGYKDAEGRFQYLTSVEASQSGLTVEAVEAEALANLTKVEEVQGTEWMPHRETIDGIDVRFLIKEGNEFTASNILRSDVLKDLQAYFQTPTVAIGIPNRNTMIVCNVPDKMLDTLKSHYVGSVTKGYDLVSDMIYLARAGMLIGAAPFPGSENKVEDGIRDEDTVSLEKTPTATPNRLSVGKAKKTGKKMKTGKKKKVFKLNK